MCGRYVNFHTWEASWKLSPRGTSFCELSSHAVPPSSTLPAHGVLNILTRDVGQKLVGGKWQAAGLDGLCLRVQLSGFHGTSSLGMWEQFICTCLTCICMCRLYYKLCNNNRQYPQCANPTHLFSKREVENKYLYDKCLEASMSVKGDLSTSLPEHPTVDWELSGLASN